MEERAVSASRNIPLPNFSHSSNLLPASPSSPPRSPVYTPNIGPRRRPRPVDGRLAPLGFNQPKSVEVNILRHGVSVRKSFSQTMSVSSGLISSGVRHRAYGAPSQNRRRGEHKSADNAMQQCEQHSTAPPQSLMPSLKDWGSDMVVMLQGIVQDESCIQKWKLLSDKGVRSFEDDPQITASQTMEDDLRDTFGGKVGQVTITHGEDWEGHEPGLGDVASPGDHGGDRQNTRSECAPEDPENELSETNRIEDGISDRISDYGAPVEGRVQKEAREEAEDRGHVAEEGRACVANELFPLDAAVQKKPVRDELRNDQFGLPFDCPPPSMVYSAKVSLVGGGCEDKQRYYYSGAGGRTHFFATLRAMNARPAEADQIREVIKTQGPEGEGSGADTAHRIYLDSLAKVSSSLAPPRPTMLHQKHVTILDLTQFGIGDTYGQALAATLEWMTHLQDIRLADNRLTDESIPVIIDAMRKLPDVTALDLSNNDIDELSSVAVKNFIGTEMCGIKVFKLSGADVDDGECSELLRVAVKNKSLTDLDLSQNMIGLKEPHKVGDPDYETGVDAIAKFLEMTKILRYLDVSQNYIGVQGEKESSSAVKLAKSLRNNTSIIKLNLASNSMKNLPAQELGNSLNFNETLEELDLSDNNLTPGACSVIASSFAHNATLTYLNLDGNAPGIIGSRDLLQALRNLKSGRKKLFVSMMKCNSEVQDDSLFDVLNPQSKTYTLQVSRPYDRMVASELKRIATCQDGVKLVKVVVDGEVLKNGEDDDGRLERRDAKVDASDERTKRLNQVIQDIFSAGSTEPEFTKWHVLDIFDTMALRPTDASVLQIHAVMTKQFTELNTKKDWNDQVILLGVFRAVFYIVDTDASNALSASEIRHCVGMLGLNKEEWTDESINILIQKYDTDGNGELESEEFISYMMSIFSAAPPKVKGEYFDKIMNKPWNIPTEGVVALTVEVEKSRASVDEVAPDSGVEGLLDLIRNASTDIEREKLFHLSTSNTDTYFTRHQAQRLVDMCRSTISMLTLVDRCVRVAASPDDAVAVVEHNLISHEQKVMLRLRMGQAWLPIMGLPGGTYRLEYGNQEHHYVSRLMSGIAVAEREESRRAENNTSQLGDWLNFRNATEQIRNEDPESGVVVIKDVPYGKPLDPRFLSHLPGKNISKMQIQFDYVSTTRPNADVQSMSDNRFQKFLGLLGIEGNKTVLNAKPLPDFVDRNLTPDVVQERYFAMRRSTYRELQAKRATEAGEGFEGYNWEFPTLVDVGASSEQVSSTPTSTPIKSLQKQVYSPKKAPEEIAAEGRIRKAVDEPVAVQDLNLSSAALMYRTLLVKLYEVQAHACRLNFSIDHIITLWGKFCVPHVKDSHGRTVLQQVDPGGSSVLCNLHRDVQFVRMELLLSLFSRIVDIENFPRLLDRVSSEDEYEIYHRIGWLNVLSTAEPNRWFRFELSVWEQREAVKIFIALAEEEDGKNWLFQRYRRAMNSDYVAGWDLPAGWTVETPRNKSGCWDFGFCEFLYATPEVADKRARFEYRKRTLIGRPRKRVSSKRIASDGSVLSM